MQSEALRWVRMQQTCASASPGGCWDAASPLMRPPASPLQCHHFSRGTSGRSASSMDWLTAANPQDFLEEVQQQRSQPGAVMYSFSECVRQSFAMRTPQNAGPPLPPHHLTALWSTMRCLCSIPGLTSPASHPANRQL